MALASPKTLPRSPAAENPSVIRMELKLNREESARLQEANAKLDGQTQELRNRLKHIKSEVKTEARLRKKLVSEEEIKNAEKMNEYRKQFAVNKVKIEESRKERINEHLTATSSHVSDAKSICGSMKKALEGGVDDMARTVSVSKQQVRELSMREPENEASKYREIENNLQVTYDVIPDACVYTGFPTRPKCELSSSFAFEIAEQPEAEQEFTTWFVPVHLTRTMKWIRECLH